MKKLMLLCLIILSLTSVSALCNEGQIDINSASAIELDKIKWVGSSVANDIISKRPFNSLDELVNVNYITESRIEDIKNQGLACVNGFEEEVVEEEIIEENQEIEEKPEPEELKVVSSGSITAEIINLEPPETKDIKSEDNTESLDKTDYAKYGFIGFCILIGVLLILKNKKKSKNEIV